jgi:hypothetical protein
VLSALEFLFGAFIVIAHNVFRVVPNEVIFTLATHCSNRVGRCSRANSPRAIRHRTRYWLLLPALAAPAHANEITGSLKVALTALLVVWTFAAFGEEIAYRGYLLTRAADIGGKSTAAYWIGIVCVSILFGYGHYYKGPSGVVDSGTAGLFWERLLCWQAAIFGPASSLTDLLTRSELSTPFSDGRTSWITRLG